MTWQFREKSGVVIPSLKRYLGSRRDASFSIQNSPHDGLSSLDKPFYSLAGIFAPPTQTALGQYLDLTTADPSKVDFSRFSMQATFACCSCIKPHLYFSVVLSSLRALHMLMHVGALGWCTNSLMPMP